MSLEVGFSEGYWETALSTGVPTGVPQAFSVSIGGRVYPVINTSFEPYRRDAFRHRSIQSQRESIDLNNIPGEGTVNSSGLWRREATDWHLGAGQPYQDRKGSSDARFSASKGVNPWMQWELSLLPDTRQVVTAAGTTQAVQAGNRLYVLDTTANTVKWSSDLATWTSVTGLPAACLMLATNGYDVWVACGASGIYNTNTGTNAATNVNTGSVQGVWWVAERLMAAQGSTVYNIIANGALPAGLWAHPSNNWVWSAMDAGSSQIYMAGYNAGNGLPANSTVFRSIIEPTGTALTVPVQALPMEGGEYVTAVYGYLNYIFLGTNQGVRMCRTLAAYDPQGNQGDLQAGPLIPGLFPPGPVSLPVRSIVGNGRFVYFGWSNYDGASTGIGRMDLGTFVDTQAPAFTSDLMVTGQGEVTNLVWSSINNAPVICVSGKGVYTTAATLVPSGYVDSGYITFGIPDDKIVMAGDIGTVQPQYGPVSMSLAADGAAPALVGTQQGSDTGGAVAQSPFAVGQIRGEMFRVRSTLTRDAANGVSPILHRWTIKALPAITAGTTISVVLSLTTTTLYLGQDRYIDPYAELAYLENLRTTQTPVIYIEGPYSASVVVNEIDWLPFKERDSDPHGGYIGDLIVYLQTFDIGA